MVLCLTLAVKPSYMLWNMEQSFHTFVVYECIEGTRVPRYIKHQHGIDPKQIKTAGFEYFSLTPYSQLAGWIDPTDIKLVVALYHKLIDKHGEENVEFLEVKIDVQHSQVPLHTGDILEERRRVAMNKLRPDEYKVLGIEQLGVYHKLKYHKDE